MSKIEKAIVWAEQIARDDSNGYSQINRWGTDYDCSSLVISALEQAGIPAKSKGATNTKNMPEVLKGLGFKDVMSSCNMSSGGGLQRGDILWSEAHTAFYCGNGLLVHGSVDENGTIYGKIKGDQTGKEICIRSYYNKPWEAVYRFDEGSSVGYPAVMVSIMLPLLRKGCKGASVGALQAILNAKGFDCGTVDSDFGVLTDRAVRDFQKSTRLEVDGIVGHDTWTSLLI